MDIYLSIDLGTTGCRSMLFDENLNELAYSYEEYGLITLREGWTEQDANLWWDITLKTAKDAINKSKINPLDIKSIAVSSQGITIVPVDEKINPLRNAISWLDVRASEQTKKINEDFGDELFKITGKDTLSKYTLPKLLWLKENEKDVYDKAYKFLMPCDFLVAKMTGNFVTENSMASGTLMFDLKNNVWFKEILDKYDIDVNKLPSIANATDCAGKVTSEFASFLGLSPDCRVAVSAQDQKCASYGAGLKTDTMTVSLGTAAAVIKLWEGNPDYIKCGAGWCGYVEKDTVVSEGVIATAGTCLRYVRDTFFNGESYKIIDKEAEESLLKGSSPIFLPYFGGASSPDYYPDSTGVFYGITLSTTRGDIALSVMEGVAFSLKNVLTAMKAYESVDSLILFGGGAKGDLWSKIIAGATGLNVITLESAEAAGAGAARIAAAAIGKTLPTLKQAKTFKPENTEYYEYKYQKFLEIEKKLFS